MQTKAQNILTAAAALFNQHGFRKVTMSDIAEAAGMSRPSLYAAFPNKEAVFAALAQQHLDCAEQASKALPLEPALGVRLGRLFDVWIIDPFASVVESPAGLDLLGNAATYAPEAVARLYAGFEKHLLAALKPAMGGRRGIAPRDVAHVMMLATKGLKATTTTVTELRRMTDGLIKMAVATAESS